ncbi:YbaN family protein [Thermotoga sp. SG1]|uniref:YbaN family protein n=1 Tax=Thermotoga sp. SG1 TaxID=126739 RepID=UPI0018EBDD48|nr:YbaN family protein [Thermotoga sp. SG1]
MLKEEKILKLLMIFLGTLFVILGTVGIFLPLVPTTPFLLLAAICYARGSRKFYEWLVNNKLFGNYIKNYLEKRGIPLKTKIVAIATLWGFILLSAFTIIPLVLVKFLLLLIAVGVTIHILKLPTLKK